MNKKLLLVLAANPDLSTKYANIVISRKVNTKAVCALQGLTGFIESLSHHFRQAGGVLLAADTFTHLDISPAEAIKTLLKAKPLFRVLVFRMGGMGNHSYSKLIEAGASSVYVGVIPNSGSFSHWVTENFLGTPSRMVHMEKISGRAPSFIIPSESLNEDEEETLDDDENVGSRAKKSTASVKKKAPSRQKVTKKSETVSLIPPIVSILLPHSTVIKGKVVPSRESVAVKRR